MIEDQRQRVARRRKRADRQATRKGQRVPQADWRIVVAEARLQDLHMISQFLESRHGV